MDTPLNIVVVEDHEALRNITVKALLSMGHDVVGIDCAEALADEIGARTIDLLVLDLNLPGENGISLAQRLRTTQPDVGIIMLTARKEIADKLAGYKSGADIYLTKPTSVEELGGAVQALARRIKIQTRQSPAVLLDLSTLTLQSSTASIQLSAHEAGMLVSFTRTADQRMEHWQLMALFEAPDTASETGAGADYNKNTLEAKIARLRKKLIQAGAVDQPLRAIRGQGYQLCIQLTVNGF